MGIWPLILVTNPKDAKYLAPTREPIGRMLNSTHVRILVFSTAGVESVQLFINGEELPTPAAVDVGPLYVSPWQPSKYSSGLHDLTVIAADNIHRKNVYRQKFSLDGTLSPMDRLPQLLLLTDFHSLVRYFLFIKQICPQLFDSCSLDCYFFSPGLPLSPSCLLHGSANVR